MIAVLNASGITGAKTVIFLLVYYDRSIAFSKRVEKKFLHLKTIAENQGWKAILLGSIIPVGGDIIYVTLGIAKFNKWKFIIFVFLGKFILSSLVVLATITLGRPFVTDIVLDLSNPLYIVIITLSSILMIGIMAYFLLKIDIGKTKRY